MPVLKHEMPSRRAVSRSRRSSLAVLPIGVIVAAHAARIERTAEQLIDGQAEHFAANVPQRLVDAGDRRADHRAGAVEAVHVHRLPVVLHLHRVGADEEVAKVVHAGHDGAGFAFERAFAPADDALVGFELDEDVGAVGIGRERDAEDLHAGDADASRLRGRLRRRLAPRSAPRRTGQRPIPLAARNWRRLIERAPCTSRELLRSTVIPRPGPGGQRREVRL